MLVFVPWKSPSLADRVEAVVLASMIALSSVAIFLVVAEAYTPAPYI